MHLCFDTHHIYYFFLHINIVFYSYTADLKPELTQPYTATNKLTTFPQLSTTLYTNINTTSSTAQTQVSSLQHNTAPGYKSTAASAEDDNFNDFGYWRKPIPTINI